jgi:5-methylcytosine-specific restriction endonuclease McrA
MAFAQRVVDNLLARTGRMCAVCNRLHGVQVHHIVMRSEGGSDDESNAIPLCPNCHDEVHAQHAPGRTTRVYTENELRQHLHRTVDLAASREPYDQAATFGQRMSTL